MQYLTIQIVLTERKTSLFTLFCSIVKNNGKEVLKLFKNEKGKVVSSNFQEIFNWKKARKNKNKNQNNAFCFPFIGFFAQSSEYQIWNANMYSVLTNGNQTCAASVGVLTRISKFYDRSDPEHKFH